MTNGIDHHDGDPVTPDRIPAALTAAEFRYDDGATQTFTPSGTTTYVEKGQPTNGEWYVDDDGHFSGRMVVVGHRGLRKLGVGYDHQIAAKGTNRR